MRPTRRNQMIGLGLALCLAALVRLPFWLEALRTPLSADAAITGLMAMHPGRGTTFWGQPYGSPLEGWLLAPFLALPVPGAVALRCFYFALGLALVPLAWLIGRSLDARAALPAALLMACPSPYMLVMASLPPPLYPLTLVFCGLLLAWALRLGEQLAGGAQPRLRLAAWGALAGVALWTHLMSLGVVLVAALLFWRSARGPARLRLCAVALAGLLLCSAPLWLPMLWRPGSLGFLAPSIPKQPWSAHARQLLGELHRPLGGLLGTHLMIVPDGASAVRPVPGFVPGVLLLLLVSLLGRALWRRSAPRPASEAALFWAVVVALLLFFGPARAGPHTLRFLTPAYLPLAALLALGCVLWAGRAAPLLALTLMAVNMVGSQALLQIWRQQDRAAPPFSLPDLQPIAEALRVRGLSRAFASYETAYRLTFETGERVVASQPWNERFRHQPMPYLDQVRSAPDAAWVLAPWSSGIPSASEFASGLETAGIRCRHARVDRAQLYYGCAASFGPEVVFAADAGLAGDGDPLSAQVVSEPGQALTFRLATPLELGAVTLLARERLGALPRALDLEWSPDGRAFEVFGQRRPGGERDQMLFVNGHVEYAIDDAVWSAPLGGRRVAALRLVPIGEHEPWSLAEVLLHPAGQETGAATWQVRLPSPPRCGSRVPAAHAGLWRQSQIALRDCPP